MNCLNNCNNTGKFVLTTIQMLVVVGVGGVYFVLFGGLLFYFLLLIQKQNQKQPISINGLSPSKKNVLREGNICKGQIIGGTVLS